MTAAPQAAVLDDPEAGVPTAPRESLEDIGDQMPSANDGAAGSAARTRPEDALCVARELAAADTLDERLVIYRSLGERCESDARRILGIAACRWPEMMPTLNDEFEWVTPASADLG